MQNMIKKKRNVDLGVCVGPLHYIKKHKSHLRSFLSRRRPRFTDWTLSVFEMLLFFSLFSLYKFKALDKHTPTSSNFRGFEPYLRQTGSLKSSAIDAVPAETTIPAAPCTSAPRLYVQRQAFCPLGDLRSTTMALCFLFFP